jgi:hypothetical protein
MSKQTTLTHVTGAEREYLEKLIETLELWSETHRAEGRLVSAGELMQATRYLRRLLPLSSRVHERVWNNGDMFPQSPTAG